MKKITGSDDFLKRELITLEMKYWNTDIPAILFHYTDASGVLGITDTNKLWATHILYLNDAAEISYTYSLVDEICDNLLTQAEPDAQAKSNYDHPIWIYRDFLLRIKYNSARPKPTSDIYVVCFCEDGDLLSQWREYGNRGAGYAIGFNIQCSQSSVQYLSLRKIIYSPDEQKQILKKTIEMFVDSLKKSTVGMNVSDAECSIETHARLFENKALKYAASFKHPSFREEQEWRLIYFQNENSSSVNIKFRSGNLGVIPFAQIELSNMDIRDKRSDITNHICRIIIGPTAQPNLAQNAIKMLVRKKFFDLNISISNIPLR